MFGLGTQELLIILVVVLILFGGKKIPELMGGLGKGVRTFKKSLNEDDPEDKEKTATQINKDHLDNK